MNTPHEQAIARLMGEDLYVWCAYPGRGNGFGYVACNGNGDGYGRGFGYINGNGYSGNYTHGFGFVSGSGLPGYSSGNGESRES